MSIANFIEAERAMRELLESLRKQVAAAVDQSNRLRAGMAEAHAMSAALHQQAAQLPDPAVLDDRIETALGEIQSKLDEMTQATLARVAQQMRRAKGDLEVLATDTVMAFERSAEHARRAASGIARTVDEKLNRAAQRADEIVALIESQAERQANTLNAHRSKSPSQPGDVPQPTATENLHAIEQRLSERVDDLLTQVQRGPGRAHDTHATDAAA